MTGTSEALNSIVQRAKVGFKPEPGDYVDDEGFIVCGKCKTRREAMVTFPGEDSPHKVPSLCECRQAAIKEAQQKEKLEEEIRRLRSLSLMDDRLTCATFDKFVVKDQNRKCHLLLRSYADRFEEMAAKNQGLILYGSVGTGKTFGAACIANQLLAKGVPVVMTSFVKLIEGIRRSDDGLENTIRRMNRVKLLIIDDLGAERDTSFALERVYSIIDARYNAKLPLILTTNLKMNDMLNEDDDRYKRIYDRIFEMCIPIPFEGVSWRKIEAAARNDRMRAFMEGQL